MGTSSETMDLSSPTTLPNFTSGFPTIWGDGLSGMREMFIE
jgi:hypothetical protein